MTNVRNAASIAAAMSGIPRTSFALGFLGLICGTVAGFESTLRAGAPNAGDYGYAEVLEGAAPPLSVVAAADANFYSVRAGQSGNSSERMGETNVARNTSMYAPHVHSQTIGRHHAE